MADTDQKPSPLAKSLEAFASDMKRDWDDRAKENAKWFIHTAKRDQSDDEFYRSGRSDVEGAVFNDPIFIRSRDLNSMRLLEIGCGIGRMTRHLAQALGEVHATDVSAEMINQARENFRGVENTFFYETNGVDFSSLPENYFDLIFSMHVFQHVPDVTVIRSNLRDACRVLKPGGRFKFQVCGIDHESYARLAKDTWTGVAFSDQEIRRAARENEMKLVSILGYGTQYCWVIMRKPLSPAPSLPAIGRATGQSTDQQPRIELFGRSDDLTIKAIPTSGDRAYLTLIVSGVGGDDADANSVILEINDRDYLPMYAGGFGADRVEAAGGEVDRLIQVNYGLTAGMAGGKASVRVKNLSGAKSDPVTIEFLEPQQLIPQITLISNDVDNGMDVHVRGDKAVFRVFARGLNETATPDNVQVYVNERTLKPVSVSFVAVNNVHVTVARMPEDLQAGEVEIKLQYGEVVSQPVKCHLIG